MPSGCSWSSARRGRAARNPTPAAAAQGRTDRRVLLRHLELEGDLVERSLEDVGDVRTFDLPARPLRIPWRLLGERSQCKSRALVSALTA